MLMRNENVYSIGASIITADFISLTVVTSLSTYLGIKQIVQWIGLLSKDTNLIKYINS